MNDYEKMFKVKDPASFIEKFDLNGVEVTIDFCPVKDEKLKDEFRTKIVDLIKQELFDGDHPNVKWVYVEFSIDLIALMLGYYHPNDLMINIQYSDEIERPLKSGESYNPYDFIKEANNDKV